VNRAAGKDIGHHAILHRSIGRHCNGAHLIVMLCAAGIVLFASEAGAQCSARAVLQNHLTLKKIPPANRLPIPVRSAVDVPVWKTIAVGTFADSLSLRNALRATGCRVGDSAGEILAPPAFTVSAAKADVGLVAVSVAELGFATGTASLAEIYARARQLGFGLAAAEVAPQLRLQYFDQPIGEFLIIGMEPIKRWTGDPVILTVVNGGSGLILIGQDGRADAEISVASRFLFVRSGEAPSAKSAHVLDEGRGAVPHCNSTLLNLTGSLGPAYAGQKLLPSEQFPGPWLEITEEIRDVLVLNKISACSQAAGRQSSRSPGEYLLYCTVDEKLWTSWLVQPALQKVCGPGKLFEDIAPPDSY